MMTDVPTMLRRRRGLMLLISQELGITAWAVSKWRKVPAERVLAVERITGISRHVLRPDIYPPPRRKTG